MCKHVDLKIFLSSVDHPLSLGGKSPQAVWMLVVNTKSSNVLSVAYCVFCTVYLMCSISWPNVS